MSDQISPITGKDTIARWLAHPTGGPIIREFLSAMSQSEDITDKIQNLPLNSLVELSQGKFTQEAADELVRQANGGVIPEESSSAASTDRFTGKTVIVTGAASGIGKATAEQIIAEGGRVIAVDVTADRLEALSQTSPEGTVITVTGDITNDADIESIVKAAGDRIDGLANVAGIMDGMLPLHEVDNDSWERVIAVNVTGTFKLSRSVIAVMLKTGGGSVVNVASEASLRGNAAGTAYTASKHAVVGLTKSAAFLYGPNNIRTNAVAPGPTATGIEGDFKSEFGQKRLGPFMALIPPVTTAEVLAKSITWLLSDDSVNINGQILASDGGWSAQ
ncbi:SDR family NAD(P)-dependent oxidoreductase [Corynebacterium casei]|uniref:SDR family NAD(P)-dependent oxidoreductase n=1 Tax=Corynebacterium casei TaxID=160386 RepID=UPI00264A297C|nr:SDR family NAD(P)-dependent oxidoreductase [Corynebacterium casei]MDN5706596.1 SDR family oxidoreductase [Corynebacterium casei]